MMDIKGMCILKLVGAFCLILLASSTAYAQGTRPSIYPGDVARFVERRDLCDHLRGEIPDPTSDNVKDVNEAVSEANKYCEGTDAQLAKLKIKYANDKVIMGKLDSYEKDIEGK